MRVVTFDLGQPWPRVEHIEDDMTRKPCAVAVIVALGCTLWAVSDPDATAPNRIVGDRVINGQFYVCHPGRRGLSQDSAKQIQEEVDWPMAQYAEGVPV